jgi:hypothetical protein
MWADDAEGQELDIFDRTMGRSLRRGRFGIDLTLTLQKPPVQGSAGMLKKPCSGDFMEAQHPS